MDLPRARLALRIAGKLGYVVRGFGYARGYLESINGARHADRVNPLRQFFERRSVGRGIWKFEHYFDIYQRHFERFVGKPVHVVEVGVFSGGSLEMWRSYFGPQCKLYGVDLEQACKTYEDHSTKIFIGDQSDRSFWQRFKTSVPQVDILVDDASHRPEHQIVTLEEMLPHLSPGGVYLCEDIHGEHNGFCAYLHGISKGMNVMTADPTSLQKWIRSITLYPYIAVIEKAEEPLLRLNAPRRGTEWQPWGPKR